MEEPLVLQQAAAEPTGESSPTSTSTSTTAAAAAAAAALTTATTTTSSHLATNDATSDDAPQSTSTPPPPHSRSLSLSLNPEEKTHRSRRTRVIIVRHAEHVDPTKTKLSPFGSLQAKTLADFFASEEGETNYAAVFSSSRCAETAEVIASKLGLKVTLDERLRNWDQGVLLGLTKDQVREKHPDVFMNRFVLREPGYKVPEGESLQDRYNRATEFLHDVAAWRVPAELSSSSSSSSSSAPATTTDDVRNVIVVTHGGIIDDMFRAACAVPLRERTGLLKPYGCVSVLYSDGDGTWRDEKWALVDHLPRIVAESPTGGHLYVFPHQVGGSFPMLRGDRGELCKPATVRELTAYRAMFSKDCFEPGIHELAEKWVPKFLGTVDVDVEHILAGGGGQVVPSGNNHHYPPANSGNAPPVGSAKITPVAAAAAASASAATSPGASPTTTATATARGPSTSFSSTSTATSAGGAPPPPPPSAALATTTVGGRQNFSVRNLWTRFARDRYRKMVPSQDGSSKFVFMILENLTHGFNKPHVLDLKMGFRQHSDDESAEKIARKTDRVKSSTSASLGARLLGLQTYDRERHRFALKDKYYGRTLSEDGLQQCLGEFVAGYGGVATSVAEQVAQLREAVKLTTWRFWGSSVLVVFDAESHEAALKTVTVRLIDFGTCQMTPPPGPNGEARQEFDDFLPFPADPGARFDQGLVAGLDNVERLFRHVVPP